MSKTKTVTLSSVGCGMYRIDGEGFANTLDACLAVCAARGWRVARVTDYHTGGPLL